MGRNLKAEELKKIFCYNLNLFKKNYVLIPPFLKGGYSTLAKARNIFLSLVLRYNVNR